MRVAQDVIPMRIGFHAQCAHLRSSPSLQELSDMTAIKTEDVISTLQALELIQYRKVIEASLVFR
jgi:hypothetical protein